MDETPETATSTKTITLGGKDYGITVPLTLEQLINCNVGMGIPDGATPAQERRLNFDRAIAVISSACIVDNPELTEDALRKMRMPSLREFNVATTAIYKLCGLLPDTEGTGAGAKSGEDAAGAA